MRCIVLSARNFCSISIERCYKRIFARPALSWSRPLVALATCPPFKGIASFWPGLGIATALLAFTAIGPRVRRKFHHPIGLKTIDLLWITSFPLGCGSQAKGHLRTADDSAKIAAQAFCGVSRRVAREMGAALGL